MSRALALAERAAAGKKSSPAEVAALKPAERLMYQTAVDQMIMSGGLSAFGSKRVSWPPQLLAVASAIDAGGTLEGVRESHQFGLAEYVRPHPADEVTIKTLTTSLDAISAGHVCTAEVASLAETTVKALVREAVTPGKRLTLVTTAQAYKVVGVSLLAKDSTGCEVPLHLYNCCPSAITREQLWAQFPVGTRIIVKEPYLKSARNGILGLRVDNPCNIIVHRPAPPAAGKALPVATTAAATATTTRSGTAAGAATATTAAAAPATADTAAEHKDAGNARFAHGCYEEAVTEYTAALALSPDEPLRLALHKNRAASFLKLGRWEAALADADAALAIDARDEKALFRRHSALVELGRYKQALTTLDVVCKPSVSLAATSAAGGAAACSAADAASSSSVPAATAVGGAGTAEADSAAPHASAATGSASSSSSSSSGGGGGGGAADAAVPPEFAAARARVVTALSQSRGDYNFFTLPWTPAEQATVAPYYGPIEIKQTAGKGWGLFVTRDVPAGTLLLAEPALAFALEAPGTRTHSHGPDQSLTVGAASTLGWDLTLRAHNDDDLRSKLALLAYDKRGRDASTPIPLMDDIRFHRLQVPATPLPSSRIAGIVSVNVFSFAVFDDAPRAHREAAARAAHYMKVQDARPCSVERSACSPLMRVAADTRATAAQLRAAIHAVPAADRIRAVNEADVSSGITALMIATIHRKPDLLAVLIAEGANVNATDHNGVTSLHMACGPHFNERAIKLLIDAKADVNSQATTGATPLNAAVQCRRAAAADLLLAAGANAHMLDHLNGNSAAMDVLGKSITEELADPALVAVFEKPRQEAARGVRALVRRQHHEPQLAVLRPPPVHRKVHVRARQSRPAQGGRGDDGVLLARGRRLQGCPLGHQGRGVSGLPGWWRCNTHGTVAACRRTACLHAAASALQGAIAPPRLRMPWPLAACFPPVARHWCCPDLGVSLGGSSPHGAHPSPAMAADAGPVRVQLAEPSIRQPEHQ